MRPRNVLTETNDIRKLMGLPLLKEDTGDSIKDIKKKVLNESTIEYEDDQWLVIDKEEEVEEEDKEEVNENTPAGFSLGMARQGGLTFTEEEKIDEESNSEGDDEEPLNEIEKAQKMAEERALKAEELNIKSNKLPMEDNLMNEFDGEMGGELGGSPGIDVDRASDIGGGLEPLDQVVAEQGQGMSKVLKQLKNAMTPGGPGRSAQDKEYKKFNKEFAKDPRAAVITKLKQYSPGKEDEINELINDPESIDNLIKWVNSGTSSWTGPNINESTEDWGFSQYNITLQDKLDLLTEQEDIEVTVDDPTTIAKEIIDATVGSLARGEITKYLDAVTAGVWGAGTDEEALYDALKQLSSENVAEVGKELEKLIGSSSRAQFDIGNSGLGNAFDRLLRGELTEEEYKKAVSILKGNGLFPKSLRAPRGEDHDDYHYIWWVPL